MTFSMGHSNALRLPSRSKAGSQNFFVCPQIPSFQMALCQILWTFSFALLQVLNKIDLIKEEEVQRLVKLFASESTADVVLPIAAKYGAGVQEVKQWASQQLKEGPSLYPKVRTSTIYSIVHLEVLYICMRQFKLRSAA